MSNTIKIHELEEEILYKFKNINFLVKALNHPSILKFPKKIPLDNIETGLDFEKNTLLDSFRSYEKLEFLGDKILNLVIAELIFKLFANDDEGALSIKLNYLVSGKVISEIGSKINLTKYINMSLVLKKNILNISKNIIEDCMEAIIGAIYLDGGFYAAQKSIIFLWKEKISESSNCISKDYKSKLQETLQKNGFELPVYKTIKTEGSDHEPKFFIKIEISNNSEIENTLPEFIGDGPSLKSAHLNAAKKAVEFFENNGTHLIKKDNP
jgi:ribonuclease-3